jgi:CSLREA domain-containing protein
LGAVVLGAAPVFADYVVNSTNDADDGTCDGTHCSLREAINAANATSADDTITFSVSGTITLGSTLPAIVDAAAAGTLTIDGGGNITISGNNSVQVMIVNSGANLTLQNLTIANGKASSGGGILNGGTLTITNSTFSGNSASGGGDGGGIFNIGDTVTITNSTFSGNSADRGGGINNLVGTLSVTNSTFSNNSANFSGGSGGIRNFGTATLKNTIIANSPSGGNCSAFGTFTAQGTNFATDGTCSGFTQVTPAQLNLGPLAVNAPGTTATHALLSGSVAIDAATDCTDTGGTTVTTDQRAWPAPRGRSATWALTKR